MEFPITLVDAEINIDEVRRAAKQSYGNMVKAVVDVENGVLALGGKMHADASVFLLERGSKQESLWGIKIYPNKQGDEVIEFNSLINVRPLQGNRSRDIEDETVRGRIRRVVHSLILDIA